MISGWVILLTSLVYLVLLFAVAYYGDWRAAKTSAAPPAARPMIYALSLAVFCTSWTFFGSVGIATRSGVDFLPVYVGPILMMILGWPLILRIIRLAKSQNITSVADFIAARYGKNQMLGSIAALIAVAGTIPYIALQLKAVSGSVTTLIGATGGAAAPDGSPTGDVAFAVAMSLALFAVLFGTRHIDATEHQDGLVLAIAVESLVKLLAFVTVGIFITYWMFDGFGDLWTKAQQNTSVAAIFENGFHPESWISVTFLSFVCIILLPRQFHVTVVESHDVVELKRARWLFPLYLVIINIFVIPIAVAGLLTFPPGQVDGDNFVLALPQAAGAHVITMVAFVGGLSAATAMVIVASIALAIMICNNIVVPFMLRRQAFGHTDHDTLDDIGPLLLNIRRLAIIAVLVLAYGFHRTLASGQALGSIGLLSFAAIAQLAPAFFGGLFWSRANARGALIGITLGFLVWIYTLLMPGFAAAGWNIGGLLENGPLGISWLRPQGLFGVEMGAIAHGVLFSMLVNIGGLVAGSLWSHADPIERMQARIFVESDTPLAPGPAVRIWRSTVTVSDLMQTTARYLGADRTDRAFAEHARTRNIPLNPHVEADLHALRFTEHLLASAIGAASSRLVLSLLLKRNDLGDRSAIRLLDDASEALQYNRDLLQSALDQVAQGIAVFDKDLRLICWNRQFRNLLRLPEEAGQVGIPLESILRMVAEQGDFGAGPIDAVVSDRMSRLIRTRETFHERMEYGRRVLEINTSPMPQGGIVTTFTDITERVQAADALTRANENLERRVRERTTELVEANHALTEAKSKADEANRDKTRFLAAASHDILQPLNAARLYTSSLVDRAAGSEHVGLVRNVDASLEAVEDILGALLDISRLDSGTLEPEYSVFPLDDLIARLVVEFNPLADDAGLKLKAVSTSLWVYSDRRLLRRVLQNMISNAIKYTEHGGVLIGCRRRRDGTASIEVWDTGPGIPLAMQSLIFKEFHRLEGSTRTVRGLGLGLSIVQRIGTVLNQPIAVNSIEGKGSMFSIKLPIAEAKIRVAPDDNAKSAAYGLDGLVVLCLDNEPRIVESMRLLLEGWGCEVVTAQSHDEALEVFHSAPRMPDAILADFHLDHGTGLETIHTLRTRHGGDLPAVIITADQSAELHRDLRQQGIIQMRKPLKPAALRAFLGQVRQGLRSAAE